MNTRIQTGMFRDALGKVWSVRVLAPVVIVGLVAAAFFVGNSQGSGVDQTVSGRVYNGTTGAGYANAAVYLCGDNGYAYTNAEGNWSAILSKGAGYCVRVVGGTPAGLPLHVVNPRAEVPGAVSYEYQVAGKDCSKVASCATEEQKQDLAMDDHMDVAVGVVSNSTPVNTPVVTPTPSVAGVLAAPGNFAAQFHDAKVTLSWKEVAGATSYQIDRSLDGQAWSRLGEVAGTAYEDKALTPDLRYFYRLVAANAGQTSPAVLADIIANASGARAEAGPTQATSEDGLALAQFSQASVGSTCAIAGNMSSGGTKSRPVIAGPYRLTCTTADGGIIAPAGAVTWSVNIVTKITGYNVPQATTVGQGGKTQKLSDVKYDKTAQTLRFSAPAGTVVAITAATKSNAWLNYVAAATVLGVVFIIVFGVILRLRRRQSYRDYLRNKYYNL